MTNSYLEPMNCPYCNASCGLVHYPDTRVAYHCDNLYCPGDTETKPVSPKFFLTGLRIVKQEQSK